MITEDLVSQDPDCVTCFHLGEIKEDIMPPKTVMTKKCGSLTGYVLQLVFLYADQVANNCNNSCSNPGPATDSEHRVSMNEDLRF